MVSENYDEEGLLKVIKAFELSEKITKLGIGIIIQILLNKHMN